MMRRFIAAALAAWLYLLAGPVAAQDLLLTGVGGPGTAAGAAGFSVTWKGANDKALGSTNYTFDAITVGSPDNHRLIVVALAAVASSGLGIPTVNINSNAATCFITDNGSTRIFMVCELLVTTGTTVTVDVPSFSVSVSRASIDVWSVLNANGDTHSNVSSSAPPTNGASPLHIASLTIADPTNGAVICGARSATTGTPYSWSQDAGASGTSSDHTNGTTIEMSAYTVPTPGASGITYTATQTGSLMRGACVAFKP